MAMRISRWIASRTAPGYEELGNLDARTSIGLLEGWISIVVNMVLTVIKVWLGLLTGSLALLADAFHTFADSGTSVLVVFGFRMARKPPDEKHPFGHGRVESVTGLVIAVLLGVIALEMGRAAVDRLLHPRPVIAPAWVIAIVFVAMVIKELLARFSFDLGEFIDSSALIADAWHHRSDVLATGLVIVAFLGARWGVPWLDGAMSVGVAVLIAWAAYSTMNQALGPLLGEPAGEGTLQAIGEIARSVPGVRGVHDVMVHRYGLTNVISLNIEVSADQSPMVLHALSETVEDRVAERFPGHAIVHVDPVDRDHVRYGEVENIVRAAVAELPDLGSYHDLRIVGGPDEFMVILDVTTPASRSELELKECSEQVAERIRARFPRATVHINIEPPYARPTPPSDASR
jgi:cation diffusion facilitator family transporter